MRCKLLAFSLLQIFLDVALYQLCFLIFPVKLTFEVRIFLAGTMIAFFAFVSLYGFRNWTFWDETKSVLNSWMSIILVSVLFLYTSKIQLPFWRILADITLFIPITLTARYTYRRILFKFGLVAKSVIILGAGDAGQIFAQSINLSPFILRKVLGFLDDDDAKQAQTISGVPVLGKLKDFERIQADLKVDEAVIAIPTASRKTLAGILNRVEQLVDRVLYIPDMYMLTTYSATIRSIDGMPIISASSGLLNPVNRFVKNIMDYIGGFAVLVLVSPLMIYTAFKIKSYDGGDIFFRHLRVGRHLKPFYLYKFRTMVPDAEKKLQDMLKDDDLKREFEEAFKFKDDPRVTPIGKFLRRTSLDELPQIFNVLRGEMSLTGPRPIVQMEVELYYGHRTAQQIFHVKPGMTGFWQVSGRNDVKDYQERIDMDLYYIHNWSVWLDIIIMFRTISVVVKGTGAY